MRLNWRPNWFHPRARFRTPTLAGRVSHWLFPDRHRRPAACAASAAEEAELPPHRVMMSLPHHLEVNRATQYLQHCLDCDGWHVACRHDHQVVVQLTRGGRPAYGVSYECSSAVEKAVYHGSRAWALTLIPLHGQDNLSPEKIAEIKAGLAGLHG
jgi:hypothetical protein